jgi:N-acetyl-anhydromuramyl-L-alanine amidase AmpD
MEVETVQDGDLKIELDAAHPGDFSMRLGVPIDTLVLHTTEGGSISGATEWWDRPEVVASAHYVIDGQRIVQRVSEADAAYHAGSAMMNRRSIGIEVVGHADRAATWSPAVLAQLVSLSAAIVARHGIPVHRGFPGVIGHCDVPDPRNPELRGGASHHVDPGPHFPWSTFLEALGAELAPPLLAALVPPLDPVKPGGDT